MPCGCHFDMIDDTLFDMTLFEMTVNSGSNFEMTLALKSRKSSERLSIRDGSGLSFRYDGANMIFVFKWHTAPVDCESVRGSQIFLLWNFRPEIKPVCQRFVTKTVESMAICFYGREFGYMRLRSKVWLSLSQRIRSNLWLCLSWRKWRICWIKRWVKSWRLLQYG